VEEELAQTGMNTAREKNTMNDSTERILTEYINRTIADHLVYERCLQPGYIAKRTLVTIMGRRRPWVEKKDLTRNLMLHRLWQIARTQLNTTFYSAIHEPSEVDRRRLRALTAWTALSALAQAKALATIRAPAPTATVQHGAGQMPVTPTTTIPAQAMQAA
jgi:hypothetical protein